MRGGTVEQEAIAPRHTGAMADATCVGKSGTPGRGPFMVVYLRVTDGIVMEASCQTYGCPAAIACGSKLSEWARGKNPTEAAALSPGQLRGMFRQYPRGKRHCARISVAALRDAAAKCVDEEEQEQA